MANFWNTSLAGMELVSPTPEDYTSEPVPESQPVTESDPIIESAPVAESDPPTESDPPAESDPVTESAPLESQPLESAPIESEPADSEPVESVGLPDSPTPAVWSGWPWLWGVTAVLLIAAAAALIAQRGRRKGKHGPAAAGAWNGTVQVGKVHQQGARDSQQDCFSVSPEELIPTHGLLAVVADGMGGLSDGDKVSQAAVTAIMNSFYETTGDPDGALLTLLARANQAVNTLLGPGGRSKSGSTLVMGLIRAGKFHYLCVGDSRICLYRAGTLYQLNREHIYRHELNLKAVNGTGTFQEAATHPTASGLTSYLGMGTLKYADVPARPADILPGDKFILMSDGVYNALTDAELTAALDLPAEQAAAALEKAIQNKHYPRQDNYTAVILDCGTQETI